MKTFFMLCGICCLLAGCDQKARDARMNRDTDAAAPGPAMPLPGDATKEHWSGPSSGKSERALPDPVSGTPNQNPTP